MSKRKRNFTKLNLELKTIEPLNSSQDKVFESEKHMVLLGSPGTGKTFLAATIAIQDIWDGQYSKLVIVRSAVPTRDQGFLPGNLKEKSSVYEAPYVAILTELFNRGDAYEILSKSGTIEFLTTSYVRGITIKDSVIILDEIQNLTFQELDSIITRVGDNCRIIFSGDFYQSDLPKNGLKEFLDILRKMNEFDFIEFTPNDIVRRGLVKHYIITKQNESRNKSQNIS